MNVLIYIYITPASVSFPRQVSISGLFNMSKMMKHVKETYPKSYTMANTKVGVVCMCARVRLMQGPRIGTRHNATAVLLWS